MLAFRIAILSLICCVVARESGASARAEMARRFSIPVSRSQDKEHSAPVHEGEMPAIPENQLSQSDADPSGELALAGYHPLGVAIVYHSFVLDKSRAESFSNGSLSRLTRLRI